jgi:polysaccharide export outer membrane protein
MRVARILLALLPALAAAGCMQHDAAYVVDQATGEPAGIVRSYEGDQAPQQYAQNGDHRALYASPQAAQQEYAEAPEPRDYARPQHDQIRARGLFGDLSAYVRAQQYARPAPQKSYVVQYQPEPPLASGGPYMAMPSAYAALPPARPEAYTLDSGDKLRVVVFGQEGISGLYTVDAGGNVSLPLVGTVPARGATTQHLGRTIADRLKQGYVRDPHVTVTIESYRPFFILGEVTTPGQYAFVPNMTVETAVAVAGGFSPRASKQTVKLTRNTAGEQFTGEVSLDYPMRPGDTIVVHERWF